MRGLESWLAQCRQLDQRPAKGLTWARLAWDWLRPVYRALGLEAHCEWQQTWREQLCPFLVDMRCRRSVVRADSTLRPLWAWLAVANFPGLCLALEPLGLEPQLHQRWQAEMIECIETFEFDASAVALSPGVGFAGWQSIHTQSCLVWTQLD